VDRMFLWDDGPGGNVEHIAEHGLTPGEVASAFDLIKTETTRRSTARPALFRRTFKGARLSWLTNSTATLLPGFRVRSHGLPRRG